MTELFRSSRGLLREHKGMSENHTRISNASSYSEIGEYWDTHDLSEHWDETNEGDFQVDLKSSVISHRDHWMAVKGSNLDGPS